MSPARYLCAMDGRVENQNQPELMRLEADDPLPGQLWCLLSCIGPAKCKAADGATKDFHAVKIRGCFATREEAERHMRFLAENDKNYDIYLADVGKWLVIPPPMDQIGDVTYHEQKLNDIFSQYKQDAISKKKEFVARQEHMIAEAQAKSSKLEQEAQRIREAAAQNKEG